MYMCTTLVIILFTSIFTSKNDARIYTPCFCLMIWTYDNNRHDRCKKKKTKNIRIVWANRNWKATTKTIHAICACFFLLFFDEFILTGFSLKPFQHMLNVDNVIVQSISELLQTFEELCYLQSDRFARYNEIDTIHSVSTTLDFTSKRITMIYLITNVHNYFNCTDS